MKTTTPLHRTAALFALALLATIGSTHEAKAQLTNTNWIYNFGTSTGTFSSNAASTTFLPAPPAGGGEDRVRVGSGGGSFTMTNVSGFGSGSALVATAPTSAAVNKFSIYDWSDPGSAFSLSFDMRLTGGTNGAWFLFAGNGATFSNNNTFSGSESFLGMRFGYGTGGAITTSNRAGGSWASLSSGISQSNNYSISIFGNNSSSNLTYIRNGLTYTNTTNSFHFWVGTNLVGTNLAKAQLASGTAIDSFMFYGESSTGNLATIALDNFNYANYLISEVLSGNFWAGAAGGGGSGIWTSSSTNWATGAGGAGRGGTQATSGALVFTNTAGTVDVGGPVTVNAGMQFATDGYTVRSNTITLAGANAAANTITTDIGVGTTINSVLAGSNGMTKAGTGTLTLGGANTYTGGTLVSGGRLAGDTTSLRGNITNNAALTFNQSTNGTYSDAISGTGSVVKSGSGSVTLSGTSSYSGGTTVSGGTLVGDTRSLQGAIANTAAVSFNQSTNGTYAGVLSGSGGTVTKSGAGTVTFTQNNTYTGATTVGAGRLVVNGSQGSSAVTVNSGASLAGSGAVGGLTVSGLLAPGNSIGTLNAGSTTFNGGGAFELEMFDWTGSAGTGWDLLAITGDLTLNNTAGNPFAINLISLQNSSTPGLALNWNQNANFTNTFINYSGSLLGTSFASDLFTVNTGSYSNMINGTFSITNVSGGLALLYTTSFNPGASYVWSLEGNGNWSDADSWDDSTAPTNGAVLVFNGSGTADNDDLNSIAGITFSNTSGAMTVTGLAFTNGAGGIDNQSSVTQTINNNLTLGAAQNFTAANGNLTFGGSVDNAGFLLSVGGSANTAINGAISGSGGITKQGDGSLTLGGNNTFNGGLDANAGTVLVNGTQATTTINVGGGTLLLGNSNRLADGATVALTTGTVNFGGFSDTIATFNQSGGVFTNGTLTATTYGLSGGTVGGTLGAGTANVTGGVTLSGVIDSTLNINTGGTLTLAAADRIGNSSAVTVDAGTLATVTFNDTVGSLVLNNGGSITGTGTITAGTYTLNGGTVGANLGTGTATSSAGTTTLNGTLAGDLTVNGGAFTLGGADRLANSSAVTVSAGTLNFGGFADTVGSFSLSGGVFTNGTVTTTTYALSGGTVGGTLGAGTANVTGGVTLSGVIDSTLNINTGGTLTLTAVDRINNSSAVTVDAGTLATATFNDTVGSLLLTNSGSITGSGTITATTYNLNGGTVTANLGTGTANVSSGTTTLNGALAASTLNIDGGTLALGGNGRIDNAAVVNLSSGVLDMSTFIDGVGTFNMTGGSVNGSGTLSAVSGLNLQAGTVNANIGNSTVGISNGTTTINGTVGGAVAVSSGTANLGGALSSSLTASGGTANLSNTVAGNVTVSGGTMNLSAADLIGNSSAVAVSSGSLNLGGNDSVGAVTLTGGTIGGSGVLTGTSYAVQDGTISAGIGGSGAMTKTGAGTTTLSANNSGFSGAVAVNEGAILASTSGALGSGTVTVTNGSTLAASGVTLANDFTIGSAGGLQSFYSQNFNSMGTSATASLPTDWKMSAAGQGTTGTFWTNTGNFAATSQAASSGSPNSGGRYNWGFSNDANNRAVGFMSSGSYAEPNSIMFAFTNTTGQTITDFTVSFDYLRFRTNSTAISNVFYMSDSSTSWGSAISTNVWAAGTSGYNFAPAPVSLTNTISLTITNGGVAYMMWTFDATTAGNSQGIGLDNVSINTPGGPTGSGTLGISEAGTATFSGNILNNTAATFTAASGGTATFSGIVSGAGTLSKTGIGTVTLSGASANTFTGTTTVSAGTLQLNKSTDVAAIAGNITVNTGATLLLSSSGNVADTAEITLSGGTILRDGGVSEVFGALTLGLTGGTLDFGTGATGTLGFGEYAPSALLTINNFFQGNTLTFGSNLTDDINNTALFSFDNGFTSNWSSGTSTFTITAIPEPSTYLAAAGLLSLMLWPSRKRLIRDAKKILGITPPMRDRLARRAN